MKRALIVPLFILSCTPCNISHFRNMQRDYRGAIHVHSLYSHDSKGTYEEILSAAKKVGLDFVIMTDHPPKEDPGRPLREGWRGIHDGVLFIQGAELGSELLALGIREPIRGRTRNEKVEEIHRQGGLAFLTHAEDLSSWDGSNVDGIEIYNIHTAFKEKLKDLKVLAQILKQYKEDPDAAWRTLCKSQKVLLEWWKNMNESRPVIGIAGNDAHQNTMGLDPYWRSLGFVSTHVLAKELTEASILEALREGRCYVSFDVLGDPRTVSFGFQGNSFLARRSTGDSNPFTIRAFRNGEFTHLDWRATGSTSIVDLGRPGRYRFEFWKNVDGKDYPWIYTQVHEVQDR